MRVDYKGFLQMVVKKGEVQREVLIAKGTLKLKGLLQIPMDAKGLVLFAHGSGSSRLSPRNQLVASFLNDHQIATLLFDLLTEEEEAIDLATRQLRFNIPLLAERLIFATEWTQNYQDTKEMSSAYFGASTGAAAALIAAAELPTVRAVVSRGGRPDLAGQALARVQCPTLLIVGANDFGVIELNQNALKLLNCKKQLALVPNATHLFEEPHTLEEVCRLSTLWFSSYL